MTEVKHVIREHTRKLLHLQAIGTPRPRSRGTISQMYLVMICTKTQHFVHPLPKRTKKNIRKKKEKQKTKTTAQDWLLIRFELETSKKYTKFIILINCYLHTLKLWMESVNKLYIKRSISVVKNRFFKRVWRQQHSNTLRRCVNGWTF